MKKVFIYASACERRELDAMRLKTYLLANGHLVVSHPKEADIILFVACAVLDRPTKISFAKIATFQKYDAELIVAGCLPAIEPKKLADVFDGETITSEDLNAHPEKVDQLFPDIVFSFAGIPDANTLFQNTDNSTWSGIIQTIINRPPVHSLSYNIRFYILKHLFGEHVILYRLLLKESSFQIRTSWGCHGNCSYCAINKAIGKVQSKPIEQCVIEFKKGLAEGYYHFILTADNIGVYGLDIGTTLPALLDALTSVEGQYDITILNVHPRWIVKYCDDLERILSRNRIAGLDIPFQSGSIRILKSMNRYSDIQKIREACMRLKKASPQLVLGTDCIIGFPSETFENLTKTLDFIKEIGFHVGTAIKYSCKRGTPAETVRPIISPREIARRFNYAKKNLKKEGYSIIHTPNLHYFVFSQKNNASIYKSRNL
ncbi:MAG: radical SAM protein [Candidatus Thermoplasmatota archaeon]|nr:radical SAM protein [Candidatus Thermoplasmatota archaeon]